MKRFLVFIIITGFIIGMVIACSSRKVVTVPLEPTATSTQQATETPTDTQQATSTFTFTQQATETPTDTQQATATPTATPTDTQQVTPTDTPTSANMIDTFEQDTPGGPPDQRNNWGGLWTASCDTYGSSIAITVLTGTGGHGNNALEIKATVNDNNGAGTWPWTSCATDLNSSGGYIDLNSYTGIRLYTKGQYGTGTSGIWFLIQLVGNTTDYSKYKYQWTPTANWTTLDVPFSSFTPPSWGQAATMTLTQYLSQVRAIEFAISAGVQSTGNNSVDNLWYIDDLEIY